MAASLSPVAGSAREVLELLRPWVTDGGKPLLMHTSGSTGVPKPLLLSHAAVLASAHAALSRLGGPGQWLSALPPTGSRWMRSNRAMRRAYYAFTENLIRGRVQKVGATTVVGWSPT